MEQKKSKISNIEWALVILALFMIDAIQFGLDWVGIGEAINWLVDIFVEMSFALYLYMRGERLGDWRRLADMAVTFFFEEITLSAIPLWGLEGIVNMLISKVAHSNLAGSVANVAGVVNQGANFVSSNGSIVGISGSNKESFKQVSDGAKKVQQAASAVQRNQFKMTGQPIPNVIGYDDFRNESSLQAGMISPRAAQIARANGAVRNNELKNAA
jgi:hypothetical protein